MSASNPYGAIGNERWLCGFATAVPQLQPGSVLILQNQHELMVSQGYQELFEYQTATQYSQYGQVMYPIKNNTFDSYIWTWNYPLTRQFSRCSCSVYLLCLTSHDAGAQSSYSWREPCAVGLNTDIQTGEITKLMDGGKKNKNPTVSRNHLATPVYNMSQLVYGQTNLKLLL